MFHLIVVDPCPQKESGFPQNIPKNKNLSSVQSVYRNSQSCLLFSFCTCNCLVNLQGLTGVTFSGSNTFLPTDDRHGTMSIYTFSMWCTTVHRYNMKQLRKPHTTNTWSLTNRFHMQERTGKGNNTILSQLLQRQIENNQKKKI